MAEPSAVPAHTARSAPAVTSAARAANSISLKFPTPSRGRASHPGTILHPPGPRRATDLGAPHVNAGRLRPRLDHAQLGYEPVV